MRKGGQAQFQTGQQHQIQMKFPEAVPAAEAQAEVEPILKADAGPAEKLKCGAVKCGGLIRTKPMLICCKCKKQHHKQLKCSGQPRDVV